MRGAAMNITFHYHKVSRIPEDEQAIKDYMHNVEKHGHNIVSMAVHLDQDHHNAIKMHIEVHLHQHKHFDGSVVIMHHDTRHAGFLRLMKQLDNWLSHQKSKMTDHGHTAGHIINDSNTE